MLDIKFIREHADEVKSAASRKNITVDVDQLLKLDKQYRVIQTDIETVQAQRNTFARHQKGDKMSAADIAQGKKIKERLAELEKQLEQIKPEYNNLLLQVPNLPWEDVPDGSSELDNKAVKHWGEKPQFDFQAKNHWQIAEAHGWIDKERAAKVAGSRFVYLKGNLVKLQWALMQFAITQLTDEKILQKIAKDAGLKVSTKPFVPVLPPLMIKTDVYEATGRLNAEEVTYKIEQDDLWLEASAEHSLAPMYKDEILLESDLPIRYLGYATSFRREAGTYGKDMEGILRLHQFDKLEMECFTLAEHSFNEHLFLIAIQEYLMQQLKLPYQVVMKCTADIGKPNARGVDIEAWLPGQDQYRETHTADYMTDYQARRLHTRVRRQDGNVELAHTNDATAFSQRPLIAILENYQQADGSVQIPEVLQPYYGGNTL